MLLYKVFNLAALEDLLKEAFVDTDLRACLINIILPEMNKPINELINRAYKNSKLT